MAQLTLTTHHSFPRVGDAIKAFVPEDHGATEVVREERDTLAVRPRHHPADTYHPLWFWFQARNDTGQDLQPARITVEGLATGPDTYEPFWKHCLWSRDGTTWERIPADAQRFGETTLTVEAPLHAREAVWIAETCPLPYAHYEHFHQELSAPAGADVCVEATEIGRSTQGRPIHAYFVRQQGSAPQDYILLVSGQHAVEQSGKILTEAVLRGYHGARFGGTPMATILRDYGVVVVPMANPDGCYAGRMNTNAAGVVMGASADNSTETQAVLALIDRLRPRVLLNCHGWGNEWGAPPYEDVYRWTDEDPLFAYLRAHVPGCSTSKGPHWLADHFRLESYSREHCGTECAIIEINWNWWVPPDGGPARQPTPADLEARALEYFEAVARYCLG